MKSIKLIKLPSVRYLITQLKESFFRFPLVIISALLATCIGIYFVEFRDEIKNYFPFINLFLSSILGVSLYFCVVLFIEKNNFGIKSKLIYNVSITVLLGLIYFSLPDSQKTFTNNSPYIRFGVFVIIAHLLVSFIPYFKSKNFNGLWNYNKMLVLRFFIAVLHSSVLFIGLILAVEALVLLFEIEVEREILYPKFFIFIAALFNTYIFVSGIPKELNKLDAIQNYPSAVKVFAQYILLPLLMLYLIIVYVYMVRILLLWDWPKGIVSYLISGISLLGIITFILLYPYSQNSWIKAFTKNYFYILFPLIILLFIAIWLRIDDYGVTIKRYVIVVMGIWLSIVSIYFSIQKSNIKFIPISLAIILILMLLGPWSMFSISENSQLNRLKRILIENSLLTKNTINNEVFWDTDSLPEFYSGNRNINEHLINDSLNNEAKSILDYLDNYHGLSKINPLFQQNLDSLIFQSSDSIKYINRSKIYMNTLGLKYEYKTLNYNYYNYSYNENHVILIKDYDYFLNFDFYERERTIDSFKIDSIDYTLEYIKHDKYGLALISKNDTLHFKLHSMVDELNKEFGNSERNIPKYKMTLKESSPTLDAKIEIRSLGFKKNSVSIDINYISGNLFLFLGPHLRKK